MFLTHHHSIVAIYYCLEPVLVRSRMDMLQVVVNIGAEVQMGASLTFR